jgi:hypothetical protein
MPKGLVSHFITIDANMSQASLQNSVANIQQLLENKTSYAERYQQLRLEFDQYTSGWRRDVGDRLAQLACSGSSCDPPPTAAP